VTDHKTGGNDFNAKNIEKQTREPVCHASGSSQIVAVVVRGRVTVGARQAQLLERHEGDRQ
jgi:hypothetical protein